MTIRAFILQPEVIFEADITGVYSDFPIAGITYNNVTTGAFGDIKPGMTVRLGTETGDNHLGRQRVRKAADASTVYIGESSHGFHDGEVNPLPGSAIVVYDDYRVWAKLPRIDVTNPDGTFTVTHYKDYEIAVGTKTGADKPPVANIGPGAGFADTIDGSNIITVDLDGTDSLPIANGATISTYAWDVDDGTITVGTSASSSITATFPAGFRWVRLTVTDSNGNSHTQVYPVYARDPASDTTTPVEIVEHTISREGQRIGINPLSDVDVDTYLDGTLVMVWEGAPATASDRTHMTFVGWHHTDPSSIQAGPMATLPDTTLICLDAAGKMDTLPAFPQSVEHNSSPSTWQEMTNLNADLMFHYMLHWHSTFLDVANWRWTGTGSTYEHIRFDVQGASLWDQVAELSRKLEPDYHFTFSRQGEARMLVDQMLIDSGSRTATVQDTIDESLWQRIEYEHQRSPRVHWRRAGSIIADSTGENTVFCVAPGEAPGQGELEEEDNIGLVADQSTLNATEGHRYARVNAPETPFNITLAASDDLGIEPADMTWVQLTMTAATAARRGLAFTDERGLPVEMNIAYDHNGTGTVKTVDLIWERETVGVPAATYIIPNDEVIDDVTDYPDPGTDPTPTPLGFGTLWVLVDGALGRTRAASAASPAYSQSDLGPGGGATYYDFILDPHSPSDTGYLATSAGLYKSTDLNLDSPSWTQVLSDTDINTATSSTLRTIPKVHASINQENYVGIFYTVAAEEAWFSFSEDGGTSWTHNLVSSDFTTIGSNFTGDVVDHIVGGSLKLYSAHNTTTARQLFISADKGDTWSTKNIASSLTSASVCVNAPYDDNAAGDVVYVALSTGAWRTVDGGDNFTALAHTTDAKDGIGTFTQDRQKVYVFKSGGGFYTSGDGGDTWTQKSASGLSGTVRAAGGFPYNDGLFFALTTSGVFLSTDGGNTFVDKTGDWSHGFTIAQYYGGTIVPLWTE